MNDELAQELVGIANDWLGDYSESIFSPLSGEDHNRINAALCRAGVSRDRITADVIRFAASLLVREAEQLTKDDRDD